MAQLVVNYIYETLRTVTVQKEKEKFTEITLTLLQTNKLSSITPGFNGFN
jgi:hypothetical protein